MSRKTRNWWSLVFILSVAMLIALSGGQYFAAESRVERLSLPGGGNAGKPYVSRDIIVWSQNQGTWSKACYWNMANGEKGLINPEIRLPNQDEVKIDQGLVIYRSNNKKQLWCTNLNQEEYWGLAPGASKIAAEGDISGYFQVSGGKIVYLEGAGSIKNCVLLQADGSRSIIAQSIRATDLHFYNIEGFSNILWLNTASDRLNYCNLNQGLEIRELTGSEAEREYISLYQNKVVYRLTSDHKLYLHELDASAFPIKLNVPAVTGPVSLAEHDVFYVNGKNINIYNINSGINSTICSRDNTVLSIDNNGSDVVWREPGAMAFWRAGLKCLDLSESGTIKAGQSIELSALATYHNTFQQDVSELAEWSCSDEEIATVNSGHCLAIAPGEVTIRVTYEGTSVETELRVKVLQYLQIVPGDSIVVGSGQSQGFMLIGIYSDESTEDLTIQAQWYSDKGNPVENGVYRGELTGEDTITASYENLSTSINLKVKPVAENLLIEPAAWTVKVGEHISFCLTAFNNDGSQQDVGELALWEVNDEQVLSSEGNRFFTALAQGSVQVMASFQGKTAQSEVNVIALEGLELSPSEASITIGQQIQYTAIAVFSDQSREDVSSAVYWQCSGLNSINAQGVFAAVETGTVEIRASMDGCTGSAMLSVLPEQSPEVDPEPEPQPEPDPNTPLPPDDEPLTPPSPPHDNPVNDDINTDNSSNDDGENNINSTLQGDDGISKLDSDKTRTMKSSSLILEALKNAPFNSKVEVWLEQIIPGRLEFVLNQDCLQIIQNEEKTLIIKSNIGWFKFGPDFAAGIKDNELLFDMCIEETRLKPSIKGINQLTPVSATYMLRISNEKGLSLNKMKTPFQVALPYDDLEEIDKELLAVYELVPAGCITGTVLLIQNHCIKRTVPVIHPAVGINCFGSGDMVVMQSVCKFSDLENQPFRRNIEILASRNIIAGTEGGLFEPDRYISRAEFTTLLIKAMGLPLVIGAAAFSDIDEENWAYPYIAAAQEAGIVKGNGEGIFAPCREINREETAMMIYRALQGSQFAVPALTGEQTYIADREKISPWARTQIEEMAKLNSNGIIMDIGLSPGDKLSRAEAANLIRKIAEEVGSKW